ncbi:hypothetical protein D3C76_1608930 [compost metagenome]
MTSEEDKIMAIKKEMAGELLDRFINGMQELGFADHDIVSIVAAAVIEGSDPDLDQETGANQS